MSQDRLTPFTAEEINPDQVAKADILVGILSDHHAQNITLTLTKASEGLSQAFPGHRAAIACLDAGSADGTREAFLESPSAWPRVFVSHAPGQPRLTGLLNLFALAGRLSARCAVVLDAGVISVKRTWIGRLAGPIMDGRAAYTAPIFSSHACDSPLNSLLAYPLVRALFGRRLLQPLSGDKAFSGELNQAYLKYDNWHRGGSLPTADLAREYLAISQGAPICQSNMADPRLGQELAPIDHSLCDSFLDILGAFYGLISSEAHFWSKIKRSRPTSVTGAELSPRRAPRRPEPSYPALAELARQKAAESQGFFASVFGGQGDLPERVIRESDGEPGLKPEEWARLVYRGAVAYHALSEKERPLLLECLVPAFLARYLQFAKSTADNSSAQGEALVEEEARIFERLKPEFLARWPEGHRP
jgi:hypothetical protein